MNKFLMKTTKINLHLKKHNILSYGYCTKNENGKLSINFTIENGFIRNFFNKPINQFVFEFDSVKKVFVELNRKRFNKKILQHIIDELHYDIDNHKFKVEYDNQLLIK